MVWSYQVDVEFSLVDADGVHLFDSHPSLLQKRGVDSLSFLGFHGDLTITYLSYKKLLKMDHL